MKKPGLVMSAVERMILAYPRRRMRRQSGRNLRATMQALDECIKTRSKLARYDVPDVLRMFDASQFCLMFQADLAVLIRDTTCRPNWWESRLYGRLLAMTMFECVDDIPTVLGKDFRTSLESLGVHPSSRQGLSAVTKGLSMFRKSHESFLSRIRTISAAHRDHDAALQTTVIESLDITSLTQMAAELTDLLTAFVLAMNKVLGEVSVISDIVRSFSNKSL